jgi:hypothetical protein
MKLSEERIQEIKRMVKASLKIEGIQPSEKAVEINERYLKGIISSQQAINEMISNHIWRA